jgi:hypothetical protein
MTIILLIENTVNYHYEIIESVICKYNEIIRLNNSNNIEIYLNIYDNKEYLEYITAKYPLIIIGKPKKTYDYYINCTFYVKHLAELIKSNKQNSKTHYYISHDFSKETIKYSNIYYLSPLSGTDRYITANILPFINCLLDRELKKNKTQLKAPIFLIQGAINKYRRDINIIKKLLEVDIPDKPFKIKLLGKFNRLPSELIPFKAKIIQKRNLNFINYHKEISECYAIITATSKSKQPQYYKNKLTSSINYAIGYNLPCLIDNELQAIYSLNKAYVYTFTSNSDELYQSMIEQFKKMLDDYYSVL